MVALRKRADQNAGFLMLRFLDKHGFLASNVEAGQNVQRDPQGSGVLLSAVDKDRERRQLQLLKDLEVLLGYPNVDGEGVSDGYKWI